MKIILDKKIKKNRIFKIDLLEFEEQHVHNM